MSILFLSLQVPSDHCQQSTPSILIIMYTHLLFIWLLIVMTLTLLATTLSFLGCHSGGGIPRPPYGKTPSDYPTPFLLYIVKHTCIRTYHAKGEVSWFKTVELAADQKSDPLARNLENSKNLNLYKENRDPNFSEGRQNLTKVARTL